MKKTILTVGAVGLAVAGSVQTAKADETDLHTNETSEQQVQVQTQTTEQKEETAKSELDDAKNNEAYPHRSKSKPSFYSKSCIKKISEIHNLHPVPYRLIP